MAACVLVVLIALALFSPFCLSRIVVLWAGVGVERQEGFALFSPFFHSRVVVLCTDVDGKRHEISPQSAMT